jgi:hypothetical protein
VVFSVFFFLSSQRSIHIYLFVYHVRARNSVKVSFYMYTLLFPELSWLMSTTPGINSHTPKENHK